MNRKQRKHRIARLRREQKVRRQAKKDMVPIFMLWQEALKQFIVEDQKSIDSRSVELLACKKQACISSLLILVGFALLRANPIIFIIVPIAIVPWIRVWCLSESKRFWLEQLRESKSALEQNRKQLGYLMKGCGECQGA